MRRPRLLDLFCGAGGAATGYHRAGFDVVGVDIRPQPRYPFAFVQGDALVPPVRLEDFDAIHASPPCQAFSGATYGMRRRRDDHPDLLEQTRYLLHDSGLPWVIENVPGAPIDGVMLCGQDFGLPIIRHRLFETSWPMLVGSGCRQRSKLRASAALHPGAAPYAHGNWAPRWKAEVLPVVWPWMTLEESGQAVPPAYTEFLGGALLELVAAG